MWVVIIKLNVSRIIIIRQYHIDTLKIYVDGDFSYSKIYNGYGTCDIELDGLNIICYFKDDSKIIEKLIDLSEICNIHEKYSYKKIILLDQHEVTSFKRKLRDCPFDVIFKYSN